MLTSDNTDMLEEIPAFTTLPTPYIRRQLFINQNSCDILRGPLKNLQQHSGVKEYPTHRFDQHFHVQGNS
jgi:hypothetical protein